MQKKTVAAGMLALAAGAAFAAQGDMRTEFNRRAAARDVELFTTLDRNGDGRLARDETKGDLNLGPRFDDIDVNRDGIVTGEELQRYIGQRYGVDTPAPGR